MKRNNNQQQSRSTSFQPNRSSSLRITQNYENMNELARLFFDQQQHCTDLLLPTRSSNNVMNSSTIPSSSSLHQTNSMIVLNNSSPSRKSTQKQQKLDSIEHTLKTPSEWKEGLSDMNVILVNMIEDNTIVRLSPESRFSLLIGGNGDSSEYLSVLPSHKPKVSINHNDTRKSSPYITCKFNNKIVEGERITRGSSQFIEMNIGTLYDKFFPSDNVSKYETQKLVELEVFDKKQTRHFSFNCCKTKSTRNLKRVTIIYGIEEGRIKNQVLNNEERVKSCIDRPSDQVKLSPHCSKIEPNNIGVVKPNPQNYHNTLIQQEPSSTIVTPSSSTLQTASAPYSSTQSTQPRKITRQTLDQDGRVTNIITEYYSDESPKKRNNPFVSPSKNTIPRDVISIDDDVPVVTPSTKKHKPNIVNSNPNTTNSVILIEDEEQKPDIKPKQEVNTEPSKTISFSSIINLDD